MNHDRLSVLIPTRGRPQSAAELLAACDETKTDQRTLIVFGVDADDPTLPEYEAVVEADHHTRTLLMKLEPAPRRGMVHGLNQMIKLGLRHLTQDAVAFLGDDHRPRTEGWDRALLAALDGHKCAVAYGNDLLQGPNLATAVVMTATIPQLLGYMAPPELQHLFVDNAWMDWGRATRLTYLPDVILEHMHPGAGKAQTDEGYVAVNASSVFGADQAAYEQYRNGRLAEDIAKLVRA